MNPPRRTRCVRAGTLPPIGASSLVVLAGAFLLRVGLASASSSSGNAGNTTSSGSTAAVCEGERASCLADAACNICLSGPEPADFCSERYPSIFHSGSAGEGAGYSYCEATGASYCCDFVDEETSIECLNNEASISLWGCVMADEGCDIAEHMPCYSGATTLAATTTTTMTTTSDSSSNNDFATTTPAPFFAGNTNSIFDSPNAAQPSTLRSPIRMLIMPLAAAFLGAIYGYRPA